MGSSKDVKLGPTQISNVMNLVTFSRSFNDLKQYYDLRIATKLMGWKAYDIRLTRPLSGDLHDGTWYALAVKMPSEIKNEKRVILPDIASREHMPLLGDTFIRAMWSRSRRLSPSIVNIELDTLYQRTYFHAYLQYEYIHPLFSPYLIGPVSVQTLDKTALDRYIKRDAFATSCQLVDFSNKDYYILTTLDDNYGRGLQLGVLLTQLSDAFSKIGQGGIIISCLDKVKNTPVRIKLYNVYLLKEILDAISYCTGLIWEWVNHNKILFIPGEEFGTVSRTYKGVVP